MTKKQKLFKEILMKQKYDRKTQDYILLALLLITTNLLIAVSIYCFLIKYQAKQKYLLPLFDRNNKLKEFMH